MRYRKLASALFVAILILSAFGLYVLVLWQ